jgi:formate--tetrahydrofolate ligase
VEAFAKGGEGALELAEQVAKLIADHPAPDVRPVYTLEESAEEKIAKVATLVYGADGVAYSETARKKLARLEKWGFAHLPVCIAKTQYSLSDDAHLHGAPRGWTLHVADVLLAAGAGFLVVVSGSILRMPGLPSHSRALSINVDDDGNITGV